jgi:hypothetical protein
MDHSHASRSRSGNGAAQSLEELFDERWIPCSFRSQCGQDFGHQGPLCGLNAFLQEYNEILLRIACIRKGDRKRVACIAASTRAVWVGVSIFVDP